MKRNGKSPLSLKTIQQRKTELELKEISKEDFDKLSAAGYTYFQESCVFDSASENLLAFAEWNYGTFHYYRIERR